MTSSGLAIESLSLRLGVFRLRNLDLDLAIGEILVILGPNGSGKSVTLETIAGFHRPDAGRILIKGRDVTELPPERRNIGFLFQNFGLFPHLTVAQNVAFGLHARQTPTVSGEGLVHNGNVDELLVQFEIAHLSQRSPQALSPGEKQRVALARALARHPDLFLFDEPFSALDARTREQLHAELHAFLRRTRIPAIFVTHDHTDAVTLADKIVVIREGEVVQSGTVSDIFQTPADPFVAKFVGIENILAGSVMDGSDEPLAITVADKILYSAAQGVAAHGPKEVSVCIRAEDIYLCSPGKPRAAPARNINRLDARVVATTRSGALCKVELDCGFPLNAYVMTRQIREMNFVPGSRAEVEIEATAVHLMPSSP